MKLRALAPLVFVGALLLAGSASGQIRRGGSNPGGVPVTPTLNRDPGWPHTIVTGRPASGNAMPGANEVIVCNGESFSGTCAVLSPGFYPYATNFLVGNDAIRSIKVGNNARLRVFRDAGYAGEWNMYPQNTQAGGLGPWGASISSLRVEPGNRSATCSDAVRGEIVLFQNAFEQGDCVVLPGEGSFSTADSMGIANDSISSVVNNSSKTLMGYADMGFSHPVLEVRPNTKRQSFPGGGNDAPNDAISSLQMM